MKYIDSRDVIARLEELESEYMDVDEALKEAVSALDEDPENEELRDQEEHCRTNVSEWEDEYLEELTALRALSEEAEGYVEDWRHGATLIREDEFVNYARELAEDLGAIDPKANWPLSHIDWKSAAKELKHDYTTVDFGGVDYYVR
jgi:hypothetical protein